MVSYFFLLGTFRDLYAEVGIGGLKCWWDGEKNYTLLFSRNDEQISMLEVAVCENVNIVTRLNVFEIRFKIPNAAKCKHDFKIFKIRVAEICIPNH